MLNWRQFNYSLNSQSFHYLQYHSFGWFRIYCWSRYCWSYSPASYSCHYHRCLPVPGFSWSFPVCGSEHESHVSSTGSSNEISCHRIYTQKSSFPCYESRYALVNILISKISSRSVGTGTWTWWLFSPRFTRIIFIP